MALSRLTLIRNLQIAICAHPKHVFKAIPFGIAPRLRENCYEEYKGYLIDQGFTADLVSQEFSRAAEIPRSSLLKTKVRDLKKRFQFVLNLFILFLKITSYFFHSIVFSPVNPLYF